MNQPKLSDISLMYQKGLIGDMGRAFSKFIGKPTRCLEIGIFEGGSALLFLEHILTHPESRYIGVDDNVRQEALENITYRYIRAHIINGDSKYVLPKLIKEKHKFDMIYIDGCHHVDYALEDIENSLQLLSDDGVVLVDDYNHPEYGLKEPIDTLLSGRHDVEVLFRDYRIAFRRVSDAR